MGLFLIFSLIFSFAAEARFRHGVPHHISGFHEGWHHGYWFHGRYGERSGWWWIVGPSWYYYPAPTYPYPPAGAVAVYVVQPPGAPQPPPAPSLSAGPLPSVSPSGTPTGAPGSAPKAVEGKQQAFTYYCEKSKSYYPQAGNCVEGWIATPVKPPN